MLFVVGPLISCSRQLHSAKCAGPDIGACRNSAPVLLSTRGGTPREFTFAERRSAFRAFFHSVRIARGSLLMSKPALTSITSTAHSCTADSSLKDRVRRACASTCRQRILTGVSLYWAVSWMAAPEALTRKSPDAVVPCRSFEARSMSHRVAAFGLDHAVP